MRRKAPKVLLAATLMSACASTGVPSETVLKVAADDLSCPAGKIKVKQLTDNNWKASGCGKTRRYVCSGSNFMTKGMCMQNEAH